MFKSFWCDLPLGLYCASIIMGAGLLTLPLVAAPIGFVPVFFVIAGLGVWMMLVYKRIAESLYAFLWHRARDMSRVLKTGLRAASGMDRDGQEENSPFTDVEEIIAAEARKRGPRQIAEQLREARLGPAGRFTLLYGMFMYVFFADIGYILFGSRTLHQIAEFANHYAPSLVTMLLPAGLALMLAAKQFERLFAHPTLLRGTAKKMLMMLGAWVASVGALGIGRQIGVIGDSGIAADSGASAGFVLFTCAILAGMFTGEGDSSETQRGELTEQHAVNVIVVFVELILLATTGIIAYWIAIQHNLRVPFYGLSPNAFSPQSAGAWSKLLGVAIFAFVGTGIFNLCAYPALFAPGKGNGSHRLARVVVLGTAIPMMAYLGWTGISAIILPPETLAALTAEKNYTTIGIQRLFESVDPVGALLIGLFGYLVALFALTSACNGFTESLADQISEWLKERKIANTWTANPSNLRLRFAILVSAMFVTFLIDRVIPIDVNSILSVAGNAGGGLLILILPWFLPSPGRRKSTWSAVMLGLSTAIVVTALGFNAAAIFAADDILSRAVAVVTLGIDLSILGVAAWLVRSEPEIPPALGEPSVIESAPARLVDQLN